MWLEECILFRKGLLLWMEYPSHLNSIGVGEELPCGCGRRSSAVCYLNGDRDLSLG